jgi:hypothetical protein
MRRSRASCASAASPAEAAQQLDGCLLFVQAVAALGQHHAAHAAAAEFAAQGPRAQAVAGGELGAVQAGQHAGHGAAQAARDRAVLVYQGEHTGDLLGAGAQLDQAPSASGFVGQITATASKHALICA